jgi:hypothetical protein
MLHCINAAHACVRVWGVCEIGCAVPPSAHQLRCLDCGTKVSLLRREAARRGNGGVPSGLAIAHCAIVRPPVRPTIHLRCCIRSFAIYLLIFSRLPVAFKHDNITYILSFQIHPVTINYYFDDFSCRSEHQAAVIVADLTVEAAWRFLLFPARVGQG